MSIQKPSLPTGTRDFGAAQMARRTFIFDQIRSVFQQFGFTPLETPTLENLSVLTGKYGDEGDQLLYKVLNSGDFLSKTQPEDFQDGYRKLLPKIAEKGLRYDLTVPFARYVAMNRNDLAFPFKRYQIQPVWRADRPQRGRYREFYQCDADVVGTDSLLCEAEIIAMLDAIFTKLGLKSTTIKINNRKILSGIAEVAGLTDMESSLFVAIDKLDKIGKEKVEEELRSRGVSEISIKKIQPLFRPTTSNRETFENLKDWLASSQVGMQGILELEKLWRMIQKYGLSDKKLQLDITLARGLSYYTGAIFEVKADGVNMGSISGGGRYDNLTAAFGLPNVSGVGISLGVDRIYDVMEELSLFPEATTAFTEILIATFDEETFTYALPILKKLRDSNLKVELYPEPLKLKKQLDYADKKAIPFVVLIGSDEMQTGILTLKNMITGEQQKLSIESIMLQLARIK